MHPKRLQKKQLDAQQATVEGLAKVEETLTRLERKIEVLARIVKTVKASQE